MVKQISAMAVFIFCYTEAQSQCPVNADFHFNRICNAGRVNFFEDATLSGPGLITGFEWDFGDGSPLSNAANPNHNYVPGLTYLVQLVVFDSSGCTDTVVYAVGVAALPMASFTFNPNNACSGQNIFFNNTSSGAGLTYLWNFGDGNTSVLQNPTHAFISYGCGTQNFNVQLTVTDSNGCSSNFTSVVSILQQPSVFYFEPSGFRHCLYDTSSVQDTAYVFNFSPDDPCIASYVINWGDGGPAETIIPPFDGTNPATHIYTSMGYYAVTITATGINGCATVTNETMVIESNPVAVLIGPSVGTNVGCAPLTVCVINNSQNISPTTIQRIDWGDGIVELLPPSSVGDTICHTYTQSGCNAGVMTNYTITLTARNSCDSSSTTWSPVRVYTPPEADFYPIDDSVCVGDPVTFVNITIPNSCAANSTTFYTWDFGDGTTLGPTPVPWGANPQQTINHIYGDTGTYIVTLTATNNSVLGCGATQFTFPIFVSDAFAAFTWDTVCYGSPTHFTDLSTTPGGTIIAWEWNFGDGGSSNAQNPNYTYTGWGDFNAWLAITTDFGCTDTVYHLIHIDTLPYVDFLWDTVCFGDPTHFTSLAYGQGAIISNYFWDFGDGNTSPMEDPVHTYGSPGTYTVTLIVTDDHGCVDSISHIVPVSPFPIADFDADTACFGFPTAFTDETLVPFGFIASWQWDFGDGSGTSGLQNPVYIYPDSGQYLVTLIVTTNIGCSDTIQLPVYVSPLPEADFTADTVCSGSVTQFFDLSDENGWPILSWQWDFGDGNSSGLQNPTNIYSSPGTYNVTLVVVNVNGCSDTVIRTVLVDSVPDAGFFVMPVCLGQSMIFMDTSIAYGTPIVSWQWDFGDGNTSNVQNPQNTYLISGNYNVTLIVMNAGGCSDTITQLVTVYALPSAGFLYTGTCYGQPMQFTDTSDSNGGIITNWDWDFGDGVGSSNLQNPFYVYADTGSYVVTLVVVNSNGCSDTVAISVFYGAVPDADFLYDTSCTGDPIYFTDLSIGNGSSVNTWQWDFGDGSTSILQNPTHPYATAGNYMVQLVVTNLWGCSDSVWHTIAVDSLPSANFIWANVCLGDSMFFADLSTSGGSSITNWYWDFGDGNSSMQQNPSHLYANSGSYNVQLIVENLNGCRDTITYSISVYALPMAGFAYSSACFNSLVQFADTTIMGSGALQSWSWDFGDGIGSSSLQNPGYNYTTLDTFMVELVVIDINGCSDTIGYPLIVTPLPQADFSADTVCLGLSTTFNDMSNGFGYTLTSWSWDFGDGNTSAIQDPIHFYSTSGWFNVQLIVINNSGCADTIVKNVFVNPAPQALFSADSVCFGDPTVFTDNSAPNAASILTWQWDFGDGNGSSLQNPVYTYSSAGVYNGTLIVTNSYLCSDTVIIPVEVYTLPQADFVANLACIGFPTSFTDLSLATGTGINAWSWDFGDGMGTSAIQNPIYTYSSGFTSYNVSLNVIDGHFCQDDTTIVVNLNQQPTADFSATAACSGLANSFTDLSVASVGSINGWIWDFGDGSPLSNLQNPSHIYAPVFVTTVYTVTLIAEDQNGCTDTISHPVIVYPKPIAAFSFDTVCNGQLTIFADLSTSNGGGISSWDWDFGDGSGNSTMQNPVYLYGTSSLIQLFNAQLIVEDINGCLDTLTQVVRVNPLPLPNFSASTACNGLPSQFADLSLSNGGILTSWNWDFGDGVGNSVVQNPSYTYGTSSGVSLYSVNLNVLDENGCQNDTTITVQVNPQPIAGFVATPACSGFPSLFADTSLSNGGAILGWSWDFGDGTGSSNAQNPSYSYPTVVAVTTYTVTLIAEDINGCVDTVSQLTTVFPSPEADFMTDSVCSGDAASFSDLSTSIGGAIDSWSWDFGDGAGNSLAQSPTYLYTPVSVTTVYPVTLIVGTVNGCHDTISYNAVVFPIPVVDFISDTACLGSLTQFLDQSYSNGGNLFSWAWDFGDGIGSSINQNPIYSYGDYGWFNVNLNVIDENQCTGNYSEAIFVDSLPIPLFTYIPSCTSGIVSFTNVSDPNGSVITSNYWDFGDFNYSSLQNPIHYFSSYGAYDVTLFIQNNRGCGDSITITLNINPGLDVDFVANPVCLGEATYFNDFLVNLNMPVETWLWSFGDGTTSTSEDPVHLYAQSGSYNVLLTVTDSLGCSFMITHTVIVNVLPLANFNSTIVQVGNPTSFTDLSFTPSGFIAGWDWNFGDGNTSSLQNPIHTYAAAGTYYATLIVTNSFGCQDTIVLSVLVNPITTAEFSADTVCAGIPMTFIDQSYTGIGNISSWYWNFGDGSASSSQNPTHVYAIGGQYIVTLIVGSTSGISDTVSHPVFVLEAPTAAYTSSSVCYGNTTSFLDQSTGALSSVVAWNWDLADGNTEIIPNFSHTYGNDGTYMVQLVVTNSLGCTDTIIKPVNVWALPDVLFEATPREGCLPLMVQFDDLTVVTDGLVVSWLWQFGDGFTSVAAGGAAHQYNYPGVFDISLTVTSNHGCTSTLAVPDMIQVFQVPIASFYYLPSDPSMTEPGVWFIDQSLGASHWNWDFGDGQFSELISPLHDYLFPGEFEVWLVVSNDFGCTDSAAANILMRADELIYFPNAMTPNGDGNNDLFMPFGYGWMPDDFEMRIYDRWGKLLYLTSDINQPWDGRVQGSEETVPTGVYVWRVTARDIEGKKNTFIGRVTVYY